MDQMKEKEKTDYSKTIANRFLDLKNGLVHLEPVDCKIFGSDSFSSVGMD